MCSHGRTVYLSAHLDDAALSCGGTIAQQSRRGEDPLVVTCFAGVPNYGQLSPFAIGQHEKWGMPADPVSSRRSEDVQAMARLGAQYTHLDFPDCIYRRHEHSGEALYASEAALFGQVHPAEAHLVGKLVSQLQCMLPLADVEIYAPLAIGNHVDHQLLLQAALQLEAQGYHVRFFEDLPYAEEAEQLHRALSGWTCKLVSRTTDLAESELQIKTETIACYKSQLVGLFGTKAQMVNRVRAYALRVGCDGRYGERYWRVSKA